MKTPEQIAEARAALVRFATAEGTHPQEKGQAALMLDVLEWVRDSAGTITGDLLRQITPRKPKT